MAHAVVDAAREIRRSTRELVACFVAATARNCRCQPASRARQARGTGVTTTTQQRNCSLLLRLQRARLRRRHWHSSPSANKEARPNYTYCKRERCVRSFPANSSQEASTCDSFSFSCVAKSMRHPNKYSTPWSQSNTHA